MIEGTKVLLAEDDELVRTSFVRFLERQGCRVTEVSNGLEAIERIKKDEFDLVITDVKMPGADGMEVLGILRDQVPQTLSIVVTGFGTIQSAIRAMKLGAFDYLLKPVDFDELEVILRKAREYQRLHLENREFRRQLKKKFGFENIIGHAESMMEIFDIIRKVADSDSTILIYGESGTGKELVAKAIHYNSLRDTKPLVPINCAAIPADLLESELFGYEKGAFTGAHRAKIGRFEYANGGTIFLDEIGEMSPMLQAKLLRVLQERSFERVGSVMPIKVDIRLIAATNQDLQKRMKEGKFREDLYYRLSVIPIHIPPLRERKEDIPILVEYFLDRFNKSSNREVEGFSTEAMELLMQYPWPGNVRELENLIERLVVLKREGTIHAQDLPDRITGDSVQEFMGRFVVPREGVDFSTAVHLFERELILQALKRASGVKKEAARLLSMKRTTLIQKMKRKNIQPPDEYRKPARRSKSKR